MSRNISSSNLLKTKTAKYLLSRHDVDALSTAIELAARELRGNLLPGFASDYDLLPGDIESIAHRHGIKIREDLDVSSNNDAEIVATPKGFVVRVNRHQTNGRKRFSIAHEIAHTCFYDGMKHKVGILSQHELDAEEMICQRIAAALLMPAEIVRRLASPLPNGSPCELVQHLERVARRLDVSLPAILFRLDAIRAKGAPYLIIVTRHAAHGETRRDVRLRLWFSCRLGDCPNLRPWSNRTAAGMNLQGAVSLFDAWHGQEKREAGRYILDYAGTLRLLQSSGLSWHLEHVNLGRYDADRWANANVPADSAHILYVPPEQNEKNAYVLSLLKPYPLSD